MTKDVLVSISGLQFEVNAEEPLEVISVGEYYNRNNKHYIVYEDMVEEESRSQLTKNTIKISKNQVEIMKKGESNTHLVFELNKKNLTCYATPFGEFLIGIYTTKFEFQESEHEFLLKLEYALDINSNHVSDCEITVKVTER